MARRALLGVALALAPAAPAAEADAAPPPEVVLDQGESVPALGAAMHALLDEGQGVAGALAAFRGGAFDADFAAVAAAGAPYQPVWAAVLLTNGAPDDGRAGDEWVLQVRTYGIVGAEAWLIRGEGLTEALLDYPIRRPFEAADHDGMQLRAQPVRLAPGETAMLLTRLVFGPVARPDLALLTPEAHGRSVFLASVGTSAWYAFLIAGLVFHLGFSLSMRSRVGVAYGVTLALALGFVAYLDGFLLRFAYPTRPGWHLGIGISILLAVAAAGFAAATLSLRDLAERGRGMRACWFAAAACLGAIGLVPPVSPEIMANVAYAAFVAMLIAQALAALQWRRVSGMPRAVLQGLTVVLALAVAWLLGAVLLGEAPAWLPLAWQIKALFAAVTVWVLGALSLGLVSMRREHEAGLRRALEAVTARERATQELLESERTYDRARALADSRRARLATASHDFRQPLASLRLTLTELGGRLDPGQRQRLEDAFDYMEDISSDLLDETRPGEAEEGHEAAQPYPLSLILETVGRMFGNEAAGRGMALRIVPSSRRTAVPPLILTRIVGNLVSNAVKHSRGARILVGVRTGGPGRLRVVVADDGAGLSPEALEALREAYAKGEDSDGTGLGLAICHDLAAQHGLTLATRSREGAGTCFTLEVPDAGETRAEP